MLSSPEVSLLLKLTPHPWLKAAATSQLVLMVVLWHFNLKVKFRAQACVRKDETHPDCGWRK